MRQHNDHRLRRPVGAALAIGAIAAATAAPAPAQSPDSVDRNRDAAERHLREARGIDGVSPDARDAADGRSAAGSPTPVIVRVTRTRPETLDWADVAIGAGGTLGLVLVAAGGTLTIARRRTTRLPAAG
jgi:hypothetical protein